MRRFLEKLFIIIFCLYNTYLNNPTIDMVFLFLSSFIISLFLDLFHNKKHRYILYSIFIAMCFWNDQYIFYLPLILYNIYLDFKVHSLWTLPLLFIRFSTLNLILSLVSLYLSTITEEYNIILNENKVIRDSLVEDTLYLQKYNEQLQIDREKNIHIAILTERNRIARELHDSIGHSISSSILQVEALKIVSKDGNTKKSLDILQNTLKNGMEDIRKSIHNLYSESLDLESKIYELGKDINKFQLELNYKILDDLSYDLKFDILSIVKESITNCTKHSNANTLTINLLEQPKFYSIIIKDNGNKFDYDSNILNKGIGLSSMKEIANKYNGFINYEFDHGFKIHITFMKG